MKKYFVIIIAICMLFTSTPLAFANTSSKIPTQKQAIAKVNSFISAYKGSITKQESVQSKLTTGIEDADLSLFPDLLTSDDFEVNGTKVGIGVMVNYYYEMTNNGVKKFDFNSYIVKNTEKEITKRLNSDCLDKHYDNIMLLKAIQLAPYLSDVKKMTFGKVVKESKVKIDKAKVSYSMLISCDGNKDQLKAIFDEKGNLVGILTVNNKNVKYYLTYDFPCCE